jgi:lambda repressor-like predicted transcriptional regulator
MRRFLMIKRKKIQRDRGTSLAGKVGRPAFVFDPDDVVRLLKAAVQREGSQSAFAKRHGVERSRLNKTLQGKVPVGRPIANALGLSRVYVVNNG